MILHLKFIDKCLIGNGKLKYWILSVLKDLLSLTAKYLVDVCKKTDITFKYGLEKNEFRR